jgi:hypothetical protein
MTAPAMPVDAVVRNDLRDKTSLAVRPGIVSSGGVTLCPPPGAAFPDRFAWKHFTDRQAYRWSRGVEREGCVRGGADKDHTDEAADGYSEIARTFTAPRGSSAA